jgi:molybdopterin/thiamine biosynthesis adenylyltransferase
MIQERYVRQTIMPEIGLAGQRKLLESRVLVVGAGGLGSPVLLYLTATGVGTLGIADDDIVSQSNLNRQILYTVEDCGRCKAETAAARVQSLNPEVKAIPIGVRVKPGNGFELVSGYDVVVDACDNLETKSLLNEWCVKSNKPLVWAAVSRFEGQMGTYIPGFGCRACVFPQIPEPGTYPTPAELGILGATAGIIGSFQALEVVKILLNIGNPLTNKLLLFDGLGGTLDVVSFTKHPTCPVCSGK